MIFQGAVWVWNRFRPQEGWLSLILLFMVAAVLILAVLEVGWVAEDSVVIPATLLGMLMGVVLAKRPIPAWMAWLLISAYGVLITTLTLGHFWPPLNLLFSDWPTLRLYWLENGAEFYDRAASWITAVAVGGRSNETIIFAYLMGLTAWFLAAYLGWSAYRNRQPLLGLTLMGLLIAINGYYGAAPVEWAAMFVGLAVVSTAIFRFAQLEGDWEKRLVDYSTQIRIELVLYAAAVGIVLLAISFLLPSFRYTQLARLFLSSESVTALEETLDRVFGGVDVPRKRPIAPGGPGGSGTLPRAFLLGNAPELERIVMMTASVELLDGPPGATAADARHWRAISYAVYTGRGWSLLESEQQQFKNNQALPAAALQSQMRLRQEVHWRYDNRSVRYTLGRPLRFDHPVTAHWYDPLDLVRVMGADHIRYEAITQLPAAAPAELRQTSVDNIHLFIRRRYTQLPRTVPRRVRDLALDVTADQSTPYDQALALERFLRQYPYSLEVPLPPPERDVVDFFLFDLQQGYCDYYASAMVVMARILGLPARLATGFLAQEPDEEGIQTMRQINAHAWAEIYFDDYGWVEFEPTGGFPSPHEPRIEGDYGSMPQLPQPLPETEPLPDREPQAEGLAWPQIVIASAVVAALIGLLLLWRARIRLSGDAVIDAYGAMQAGAARIGQDLLPGQTPYEFNADLQARLEGLGASRLGEQAQKISDPAGDLTELFVEHQYSADPGDRDKEARRLWREMRLPLWLLRLGAMIGFTKDTTD